MYLDYFGLSQPPFKITPNTGFFYAGGNRGAILEALLYAIIHGEGIVKVTGEIGSGKTMLCRMLENALPDNVEAIYLANPSLNRDEVFHAIAGELALPTDGKRGGEIMRLLHNCLIEKHTLGKQVVLLVEEAQAMPLDTLEEIRLLSNLETSHHKLLQIVLFGQPELDDHLNLPQMRQLKERIVHGFKVPPLDRKDIPEYLMFRMRAAGYRGPCVFSRSAIKLIAFASQGITRRINVLADKALLAAFSENTHDIGSGHIKAAIKDSEFAVPSRSLPVRQLSFATLLLALGIVIGASWQPLADLSLLFGEAEPIVQAVAPPPVAPAAPEAPTPVPALAVAVPPESIPAPAAAPEAEPTLSQSSLAENPQPPPLERSPLEQRLAATEAWLAEEDAAHITVQLMLLTENAKALHWDSILSKLDKEFGLAQIYIYPTRLTADRQFGITFGSFVSRKQALVALAGLPVTYRRDRPALRTVHGIKEELARQYRQ